MVRLTCLMTIKGVPNLQGFILPCFERFGSLHIFISIYMYLAF